MTEEKVSGADRAGRVRWGRAVGGFLVVEVVMVAAAVAWVAF